MHIVDIIFCGIGLIFLIIGIKRGFITEIFRLTAMIAGFVIAVQYHEELYRRLTFITTSSNIKSVITFLTLYIATAGSLLIIGWAVRKLIHLTMLGWLDRALGGLIGMIKTGVIAWVFSILVVTISSTFADQVIGSSYVYLLFKDMSPRLHIPSINDAQKKIHESMPLQTLEALEETKNKFEDFRTKVDSIKQLQDSSKL